MAPMNTVSTSSSTTGVAPMRISASSEVLMPRAAIAGNAAQPGLLEAANVGSARWLISAIPNPFESGTLIEHAHRANSSLEIIARAHSDAEVDYLKKVGASLINPFGACAGQ